MAVSGPNGEGFANTAAALCPTFSPAMDAGDVPLLPPPDRTRGQVAVISQSGGMGFAFFDHGRPKDFSFRYIVTTGNEACLEASDFAEFIIDEGKTDVDPDADRGHQERRRPLRASPRRRCAPASR